MAVHERSMLLRTSKMMVLLLSDCDQDVLNFP
jgi:hypothetical protein